jgi:hypothetical protein
VAGDVYVVDMESGTTVNTVETASYTLHGVGVGQDPHEVWLPSFERLDHVLFSEDMSEYELLDSIPLAHLPKGVVTSPDRRWVVAVPTNQMFSVGLGDDLPAVFVDTATSTIVREITMPAPRRPAFNHEGTRAYFPQTRSAEIYVVDMTTLEIDNVLTNQAMVEAGEYCDALTAQLIEKEPHCLAWETYEDPDGPCLKCVCDDDNLWRCYPITGPVTVRDSDELLCTSNLLARSVTCMDPEDPDGQWVIDAEGSMPHDLHFDNATGLLWFQLMQELPDPSTESSNPDIPTPIKVYDVDSNVEVRSLEWDYAQWHVTIDNRKAYASGSYHSVIEYDRATMEVSRVFDDMGWGPRPVMTIDF